MHMHKWAFVTAHIFVLACSSDQEPVAPPSESSDALRALSVEFEGRGAVELAGDTGAMDLAGRLYAAHCSSCHGANGAPERGVPSLQSGGLSYGSDIDTIRQTIVAGRHSTMPALGGQLGEVDIGQLVAYVQTLSDADELNDFESRGAELYEQHCIACHAEDGSGIAAVGGADLRDDVWQHGDSMMNIRLVVTRGIESSCPAWGDVLTAVEIELLTAHVAAQASMP